MASVGKVVGPTSSLSGASGATPAISLEMLMTDLIPTADVSALASGATLAIAFEHSFDGTTWKKVADLKDTAGNTSITAKKPMLIEIAPTQPIYGNVRFSWTISGTTKTATVAFSVYYDKKR